MTPFDQALSYVHDALAQRKGNASGSRASLASLRRLAEVSRGSKPMIAEAQKEASGPGQGAKGLAARVRAAMDQTEPVEKPKASVTPVAPATPSAPSTLSTWPTPSIESASVPKEEQIEALRQKVAANFQNAPVVFGVGSLNADLVFVGEAPGVDEVAEGEPFVGRSGQLLTKIIEAMGFRREEVYLANVMKCRPPMPEGEPGDRKPTPDEMAAHLPFLIEQIEIIRPRCVVALGGTAMEGLLNLTTPIGEVRGHWHSFKGTPLMPTYHPAYLLHNPRVTEKRKVWEDLLQVLELLGKTITPRQRGFFLSKG